MKTYRYSGHSRSDPATYRPAGELDTWLKRDPIDILAKRLIEEKLIAEDDVTRLRAEMVELVNEGADEALAAPEPSIDEITAHVSASSQGGDTRWHFWSK